MNERIDELIFQVGYTKLSYPDDNFLDGRYALTQEQLDKFAELIVRECIDTLDKEVYLATRDDGEQVCIAVVLLEHFGVEE